MRALFLEHDDLSKPGLLGEALSHRGFAIEEFCVVPEFAWPDRSGEFPGLDSIDVVVSMGAPWSVYDADVAGWVRREIDLLARADAAGIPVLGVCFGGQLLATAHGGTVTAAPGREFGWTAVDVGALDIVEAGPWFQWHSDRWTVPPGGVELAATSMASQAFVLRRNLAVQFHPELTLDILDTWLERTGESVRYDLGDLRRQTADLYPASIVRAESLVANFLDRVAGA